MPDKSETLSTPQEIHRVLRALQLSRSMVSLTFDDTSTYSSLLISSELDEQQFIIDEVRPEDGNAKLTASKAFTLHGSYSGGQVTIKNCRITTMGIVHYDNAFAVPFPPSLIYKQRRNAFRINVSRASESAIEINNKERDETITGLVTDLSTNGVAAEFSPNTDPKLGVGEHFDECHVDVRGEMHITCELSLKRRYTDSQGNLQCGFEIRNIDRADQKKLDRFILELQRQARRTDPKR